MYDFDQCYDQRGHSSIKWDRCAPDELPMWIAVMDFPVPPPIQEALAQRLQFPFFGYDRSTSLALDAVVGHYQRTYGCRMEREWLVQAPSVMPGVNAGALTAGGRMMYCTPMYSHIRKVPEETALPVTEVPLRREGGRFTFDFDAMEQALTADTTTFILCNPHNPLGRCFTREELERLLDFCRCHGLTVVSDEIHCELVFEGTHIPFFSLCKEAEVDTITVSSAGKICNMPRLPLAFAVIPDPDLRRRYTAQVHSLFGSGDAFTAAAFRSAYDGSCDQWKEEVRAYLRANRDYAEERIGRMPGVSVNHNEATYLSWIDCRQLGEEDPAAFFRREAGVICNSGAEFGDSQCVRLNFACPRSQLAEALDRMERALAGKSGGASQALL